MSARPFEGFELHLVGEFGIPGTGEHYCETIDSEYQYDQVKDEAHAVFFTVYGYRGWGSDTEHLLPDGGAEAIPDFGKYDDARDLAYALADGKNVEDMVPPGCSRIGIE